MSDSSNNSMETVNFRRFLSYIYAYEDDIKLRNVGFAKVEVRLQRVRFQVIVNGILQKGGRPLELCLVDGNLNRIPVGQVTLQNGRGEYRGSSNMENLWDSKIPFSQVYGICLQGAGNRRHYYMTLWREVSRPVRISHNQIVVIPKNREQEQEKRSDCTVHAAEVSVELEEAETEAAEGAERTVELERAEEPERTMELERAEEPERTVGPERTVRPERCEEPEGITGGEETAGIERIKRAEETAGIERIARGEETAEKKGEAGEKQQQNLLENIETGIGGQGRQGKEDVLEKSDGDLREQMESASDLIKEQSAMGTSGANASGVARGQGRRVRKEDKRIELWKRFCSRYPHVDIRPDLADNEGFCDGFSKSGKICEVIRIRPNDIGRLPRNNWILAHNSFLQNAYNHFHQLILFRVESQEAAAAGESRWFVGLPGEKTEQETLVAEVFGFKKFLKCKNGGFWYTEIYMGVY